MKLENPPPRFHPDDPVAGQTIDIDLGKASRGFCGFDPTKLPLEFPREPRGKWYEDGPTPIPPEDYLSYVGLGEMLVSLPNPNGVRRTSLRLYVNEDPAPDDLWYRRLPQGSYTGLLKLPGGRLHLRELSAAPNLESTLEVPAGDYAVEAIDTDINKYRTEDLVVREFGEAGSKRWTWAAGWTWVALLVGAVAGMLIFMVPLAEPPGRSWTILYSCVGVIGLCWIGYRWVHSRPDIRRMDAVVNAMGKNTPSLILVMRRLHPAASPGGRIGLWHNATHETVESSGADD